MFDWNEWKLNKEYFLMSRYGGTEMIAEEISRFWINFGLFKWEYFATGIHRDFVALRKESFPYWAIF